MADILNKKGSEGDLSTLHALTTVLMRKRLQAAVDGELEIPPAELGTIIRFLKDNGIECTREDIFAQFSGGTLGLSKADLQDFDADEIPDIIKEALG